MKYRLILVFTIILLLTGCGSSSRSGGSATKASVKHEIVTSADTASSAVTTAAAPSEATTAATTAAAAEGTTAPAEYRVGDTWTVEGQWSLTLESVEKTDERNPYADEDDGEPAEVYSLKYTYENLGYTDDILEGLYLRLDRGTIIDSTGLLGDSYPLSGSGNAKYTPVGAKCQAQSFIALKNPGGFRIEMLMYDGNGEKQTATFVYDE